VSGWPPAAPQAPTKARALRRLGELLLSEARPAPLPRSPEELSSEWLTGVLCRGTPGARVTRTRLIAASTGTTTRARLKLAYNRAGDGLPTDLFVKCTSALAQRLMLGFGGLIHGEPGFYGRVRPELGIEAPSGYFAAVAERSWHSIVVVEDVVATRGARFWQPAEALTRDSIEDLLDNVAGWHGTLWGSPRLESWTWLRTPAQQMQLIDTLLGLANRLPSGARRAREVIPAALRDRHDDLHAGLRHSMSLLSRPPHTYLHGDLHAANTYFTRAGRMGVCDWQVGLRGSWAFDFAYLLSTALAIEDRRKWERELLELYLDRLRACGGPAIPLDAAWNTYRQATLYPYFAWVYTIGRSRLQPRFQPDEVSLALIERIAAAVDDLGSLAAVGL
jgi:hypothetical protein